MSGSSAKLPKVEMAVLAFLQTGSLQEAAEKIGVSVATLARWMKREEFQTRYRDARRRTFEAGLSRLQALTGEAVETLQRNLKCGRPMVEIRAAGAILEHARHGIEILDMGDRLAALEVEATNRLDFSKLSDAEWETFKALRTKMNVVSG